MCVYVSLVVPRSHSTKQRIGRTLEGKSLKQIGIEIESGTA